MDRTSRMLKELKEVLKAKRNSMDEKDVLALEILIDGVEKGVINMFNITRRKHNFAFSPEVEEILKRAYQNATSSEHSPHHSQTISSAEWLYQVVRRARKFKPKEGDDDESSGT